MLVLKKTLDHVCLSHYFSMFIVFATLNPDLPFVIQIHILLEIRQLGYRLFAVVNDKLL